MKRLGHSKSDFLRILDERGFIHQVSEPEGLDAIAAPGRSRPMSATTRRRPACTSAT